MPDGRIKKIVVTPLRKPLLVPFRIATGEHKVLENLGVVVHLSDGTQGCGEAAIASHITGETVERTAANLKIAGIYLKGKHVADYQEHSSWLHGRFADNKSVVAAMEMAVLDALCRQTHIPLWRLFGQKPVRLKTDITIVIGDEQEAQAAARDYYRRGFRAFKIKIGRDPDEDFRRVAAVHKIVRRSAIYLDANQAFTSEQTLKFLKQLGRAGIRPALIEQPVAREDWEGLKEVSRRAGVVVCVDESARSLEDVWRIIREKAAQAVNIKLMKFGLVQGAEAARLAKAAGLKLMIGGMMESNLAMTAAAHLAAGLGTFDYIDLDTPFFVKGEAARNPALRPDGTYDLTFIKKGIGVDD